MNREEKNKKFTVRSIDRVEFTNDFKLELNVLFELKLSRSRIQRTLSLLNEHAPSVENKNKDAKTTRNDYR